MWTEESEGRPAVKITRDGGATAVEYALMVSLIAIVIVTAVTLIGTTLTGIFNNIAVGI
jgi:pilus assembly protein Flp/PilA